MNAPNSNTAYEWKQYRFNPLPQLTAQSLAMWIDMFDRGYLRQFSVLSEQLRERDDVLVADINKRLDQAATRARKFRVQIRSDIQKGTPLYAEAEKHKTALEYAYNHIQTTDATDLNVKGNIRLLARQMLLAQFDRYAVHELVAKPSAEGLTFECKWVPIYFFDNTRGFLRYGGAASQLGTEKLEEDAWMITTGLGLMKSLAICQMFKSLSLKDWMNYSQVYSEPGIHLETTAAYGTPEWNVAVAAIESFRREFRILTTSGQKFNPIEFSKTGDAPFAPMVDRMDRRMSGIILGGDMLTQSRHGANNSGASLQKDQGEIILDGDCELVTETLNAQISRLVILEVFGTEEALAEIVITPDANSDIEREIKIDTFLLGAGAKLSMQDMLNRYERSTAEEGDDLAHALVAPKADAETRRPGDGESASNDHLTTGLNDDLAPLRTALERIVNSSNDDELASAAHNLSANFPHIITAVMAGEHGTGALNRVIAQNLLAGLEDKS